VVAVCRRHFPARPRYPRLQAARLRENADAVRRVFRARQGGLPQRGIRRPIPRDRPDLQSRIAIAMSIADIIGSRVLAPGDQVSGEICDRRASIGRKKRSAARRGSPSRSVAAPGSFVQRQQACFIPLTQSPDLPPRLFAAARYLLDHLHVLRCIAFGHVNRLVSSANRNKL